MDTILITGGCGYIGSQTIIEILKKTTLNVISIDNFSNSSPSALARIKKITSKEVVNYNIDLADLNEVEKVFHKHPEIVGVIHFAALKSVPESVERPIDYYKNNLESLLNLIKCCETHNITKFIFSSSCAIYGTVSSLPVDEETTPNTTLSPYAHSKKIGEEMIKFISNNAAISFVILRYFNPVGADLSGMNGEKPNASPSSLVPVITQTAAGLKENMVVYGSDYNTRDGSCIRDYIHVIDIADAHINAFEYLAIKPKEKKYEIFNLGSGSGVTVLEAIQSFEKIAGIKVPYKIVEKRQGDIESIYSNSNKAANLLNWTPKYNIDDMMKSAWEWQKYLLSN